MYLAHYNQETGQIQGFYLLGLHRDIPEPTIEITDDQHREYFEKGQRHIVQKQDDGTLAFVYVPPVEPKPQVVTPPVNQDIADMYLVMLDMSARLEKLEGGTQK